MWRFGNNPRIEILCEPGVYTFFSESGSGKSYLYSVLQQTAPEGVALYTYGRGLVQTLPCKSPNLILCDRVDMYSTEVYKVLTSDAIVLLDWKQSQLSEAGLVMFTEFSADRIVVKSI